MTAVKLNTLGSPATDGTSGSVLFIDSSSKLAEDNQFQWDPGTNTLRLLTGANLSLGGSGSGTVTIATAAAAGTWTFTLPTDDGTVDYVLRTDGSGVTSWVAQSGMAIGDAVSGGTSGSVLFVDGSGNLAQNNTNFFWDNTNLRLKVGSSGTPTGEYWVNGVRALFGVPNASGNNWFEAGAGNATLTGYLNFGTGDGCLASLTSGTNNVGMGNNALNLLTTGQQNVAIGSGSLAVTTSSDSFNVGVGYFALHTLGYVGAGGGGNQNNVGVGAAALANLQSGGNNIAVGSNGLLNLVSNCNGNTSIGQDAGGTIGSGGSASYNSFVGNKCGNLLTTGSGNTWIGGFQGASVSKSDTICISNGFGNNAILLDYEYTTSQVWSMNADRRGGGLPTGLHIYNFQDALGSTTNYERAVLDWHTTSNVFTIGTQKGGTGTVRNLQFTFGGTNKLDYGVTTAGAWTIASATVLNWSTDTGLARNAAGVVEVNNGTSGTLRDIKVRDIISNDATFIHKTSAALTDGAGTGSGVTFTNAPGSSGSTGNPTKWIAIDDNGTTRYIPCF